MPRSILHISQILEWADAHHQRTGVWPEKESGLVWEVVYEKWSNIDNCLRLGLRGLRPGGSLARLLAKHRGKRNRKQLPKYTVKQILGWADAHHERLGRWPHNSDGQIPDSNGETWYAVDVALRAGQRGLPGGSSLAQLLLAKRRVFHRTLRPRLTVQQILTWADEHYERTGTWPTEESGLISHSEGDTWRAISKALRQGRRGLRRSSLAKILARHRGVIPKQPRKPPLTIEQILTWADEHHARTGRWPIAASGAIAGQAGESWQGVNRALLAGVRRLPGGMSLTALLIKQRGVRNHLALPPLSETKILRWARAYRRQYGRWPSRHAGGIPGSGGETWSGVRVALNHAGRGLKRRTTLKKLIEGE